MSGFAKSVIYARHKDGYTGLKYDYSYDAIGRLIRTDISKSSNGAAVGSTEYAYNTRGHLVSITNDIGGNAYGQYFSYSEIKDANDRFIISNLFCWFTVVESFPAFNLSEISLEFLLYPHKG